MSSILRVVFLGSPEFAIPSLRALVNHPDIEVVLVVTQPDRPSGRGRRLTPPPVKVAADELGIVSMQPDTLRDASAIELIRSVQPDLLIVVAYGEILRKSILTLAPLGCLNVHPSLLPAYRGATPIPAAILNGDAETGVSIIKLVAALDAGPIIAQQQVAIAADETSGSLSDRLARLAADMLPETMLAYANGRLVPREQDDEQATYTREWTTDDARIDWSMPARQIEQLIRAADPWPIAWTLFRGERLRILQASPSDAALDDSQPGSAALVGRELLVRCGDGALQITQVQPAGRRAMNAIDWWRGLRIDAAVLDDEPK